MKERWIPAGVITLVAVAFLAMWYSLTDSTSQIGGAMLGTLAVKPITSLMATTFVVGMIFLAMIIALERK